MIDKAGWDNAKHDLRYNSFYGSEEEWIKAKLNNSLECVREKDLKDFLKYIENLESQLEHLCAMLKKIDKGWSLLITEYGETIIQLDIDSGSMFAFSDSGRNVIAVVEDGSKSRLVTIDKEKTHD